MYIYAEGAVNEPNEPDRPDKPDIISPMSLIGRGR